MRPVLIHGMRCGAGGQLLRKPRHVELELWMAAHGHQIISRTASKFDWCQDKDD
jgi:hypothetical protein